MAAPPKKSGQTQKSPPKTRSTRPIDEVEEFNKLHPRGLDGTFIEKDGEVNVKGRNGEARGTVESIDANGNAHIKMKDGTTQVVPASQIDKVLSQAPKAKARLKGKGGGGGGKGKKKGGGGGGGGSAADKAKAAADKKAAAAGRKTAADKKRAVAKAQSDQRRAAAEKTRAQAKADRLKKQQETAKQRAEAKAAADTRRAESKAAAAKKAATTAAQKAAAEKTRLAERAAIAKQKAEHLKQLALKEKEIRMAEDALDAATAAEKKAQQDLKDAQSMVVDASDTADVIKQNAAQSAKIQAAQKKLDTSTEAKIARARALARAKRRQVASAIAASARAARAEKKVIAAAAAVDTPLVAARRRGPSLPSGHVGWQEWQHPRGMDGKFIEKGGFVNVLSKMAGPNGKRDSKRGKVIDLTPDGAEVRYNDKTTENIASSDLSKRVSQAPLSTARLDNSDSSHPDSIPTGKAKLQADQPMATKAEIKSAAGDVPEIKRGPDGKIIVSPEAKKLGSEIYRKAVAAEPEITKKLAELIGDPSAENYSAPERGGNGQLYGYEYRIKKEYGIQEKVERNVEDDKVNREKAAANIKDAVRYTVHYSDDTFGPQAQNIVNQLAADPSVASVNVKNTWPPDSGRAYKGINVIVTRKDGVIYEVQFHTPTSQLVKDKMHTLYEDQRKTVPRSPEWQALEDQMNQMSRSLPMPTGAAKVYTPGTEPWKQRNIGVAVGDVVEYQGMERDNPRTVTKVNPDGSVVVHDYFGDEINIQKDALIDIVKKRDGTPEEQAAADARGEASMKTLQDMGLYDANGKSTAPPIKKLGPDKLPPKKTYDDAPSLTGKPPTNTAADKEWTDGMSIGDRVSIKRESTPDGNDQKWNDYFRILQKNPDGTVVVQGPDGPLLLNPGDINSIATW